MDIKFGYKLGLEQYAPDQLIQQAKAAEENGFEIIESSDHFSPWSEEGNASFVWSVLGAIANITDTIGIGTGVTCPILRYNPAIIAQAAATIGYLANGRTMLGLGTGEALNEYVATGDWPDYMTRREMLAEAIIIIRSLWTGEEVTFNGIYYSLKKARLFTIPRKLIPIYISALVPESAYFAGQHGDGLFSVGGKELDVYKEIIENFENGADENGKDPKTLPRHIEIASAYTNNLQDAIEARKKYWAGTFVPALFNRKIFTPKESQENGKVVGDVVIKKSMVISTNPDDYVDYLRIYINLGFTHFYFHSAGPNQNDFIKGIGRNVIPVLKKAFA